MSVAPRSRRRAPAAARRARELLRNADPVPGRVNDAHPGFRQRMWTDELPQLDAFGTLIFEVVGRQLSVASKRAIVSWIEELFGGRTPTPTELVATDPQMPRMAILAAEAGASTKLLTGR
jgi:3-methyladenine DNA glycosylase/8-oxoguanine DNA glycosylase